MKVICLCGSTKFIDIFKRLEQQFTLEGHIVLSVVFDKSHAVTADEKAVLDTVHLGKIDIADEVYVINPDGYIGQSTAHEILHAHAAGIPVRYYQQNLHPTADLQDIADGRPPDLRRRVRRIITEMRSACEASRVYGNKPAEREVVDMTITDWANRLEASLS